MSKKKLKTVHNPVFTCDLCAQAFDQYDYGSHAGYRHFCWNCVNKIFEVIETHIHPTKENSWYQDQIPNIYIHI